MSFDDIPEDQQESFPCDCGGSIELFEGVWGCDSCDFRRPENTGEEYSS